MTDPIYMRLAREARESINCDQVYLIAVTGSVMSIGYACDEAEDDRVMHRAYQLMHDLDETEEWQQ